MQGYMILLVRQNTRSVEYALVIGLQTGIHKSHGAGEATRVVGCRGASFYCASVGATYRAVQ